MAEIIAEYDAQMNLCHSAIDFFFFFPPWHISILSSSPSQIVKRDIVMSQQSCRNLDKLLFLFHCADLLEH